MLTQIVYVLAFVACARAYSVPQAGLKQPVLSFIVSEGRAAWHEEEKPIATVTAAYDDKP
eukprot:CAMPEP_0119371476 /NCGR_PEP_ID=MMETSP1334-20130426/17630_1 /TAXON_ID=127549 /ORGANISM="Calcidiscus leptoporus, Strain RCC1130" /LENGTH=59 /DNA_ID=CAMNT_0007388751 /DNA_START=54 /DNA_END=230 /DNA_ORIENTATION=+